MNFLQYFSSYSTYCLVHELSIRLLKDKTVWNLNYAKKNFLKNYCQ